MTIEELLAQVPDEFRPVAAKYGPALVAMTADEFAAWIDLLIMGRTYAAWQAIMAKLEDADLLAAWRKTADKWDEANAANAARLDLQREAALAVMRVLLTAALALVGL